MTHICVSKLTISGSDNGLSPDRRQAIIWTNAGILSIGPLGTKLSEILIAIHIFSFTKMHLKMSSGKWRPCCLGLNVLNKSYFILYFLNTFFAIPIFKTRSSARPIQNLSAILKHVILSTQIIKNISNPGKLARKHAWLSSHHRVCWCPSTTRC